MSYWVNCGSLCFLRNWPCHLSKIYVWTFPWSFLIVFVTPALGRDTFASAIRVLAAALLLKIDRRRISLARKNNQI